MLLPELGLASSADRAGLLDSVAELIRVLAASRPVVLLLDDLQWIDEASSALLHVLVRRSIRGVMVAGTARAGEMDDNPWAKRLATSLARDGMLERVQVEALTLAEIARLCGVSPNSEAAAEAFRQSGGNPLLALELGRARQRGMNPDGQGIDALVADQMARLGDEDREVLVCSAVIGRAFRPELLEVGLGQTGGILLGRIGRLERLGLLRPVAQGQYDFAHDLIRQGVYRSLSQPHRRFLHRQIARALSLATADEPGLYGDLVHHAGLAEDHAMAEAACVAAAEHCLKVFASTEAAATAQRGLAHLEHLPSGREHIRHTIALLSSLAFAGIGMTKHSPGGLIEAVEKASDAAALAGLFTEAAHAQHVASWLHVGANDTERARLATLRAEQISRTADTATRCQQLANTGRCLLEVDSAGPRAMSLIAEATALADTHNLHFVELEWGRALLARWRGDLAEAAAFMTRVLGFARMREDRWREAECLLRLASIALERNELAKVKQRCSDVQAVMGRMALPRSPFADVLSALARLRQSEPNAADLVRTHLTELRAIDDKARLAYALNAYASGLLGRHDLSDAQNSAAEAAVLAHAVRYPTEAAVGDALLARIAAASGDYAAGRKHLAAARTASDTAVTSARARQYCERAAAALAAGIPTLLQTEAG